MRKVFMSCALLCTLVGCKVTESERLLAELDAAIGQRDEYVRDFERRMDSLKLAACGVPDDVKWANWETLSSEYQLNNIDSASVYVNKMAALAADSGNRQWMALAEIAEANVFYSRYDYSAARHIFENVDTVGLEESVMAKYGAFGMQLYKDILKYQVQDGSQTQYCADNHLKMMQICRPLSDRYVECMMRCCRYEVDLGHYEEAERLLMDVLAQDGVGSEHICAAYYYLSSIYEHTGRPEEAECALIRSVIMDVRRPIMRSLAMLNLALNLFEDKNYKAALKYMDQTINDASYCNYRMLQLSAIDAQKTVMQAVRDSEAAKIRILLCGLVVSSLLLAVAVGLFFYSMSKRRKLSRANRSIKVINKRLEALNADLKDSNQIKDNYVSAYMKLSTHYIRQVDVERKELRKVAKTEGYDAVMARLRSPNYADEEYKRFYRFFDDTFLGLFPDFIVKVNALLPPEHRFTLRPDGSLPTEIRIMAALRLGITKSPEIADVLNCAVRTVYKYRLTLRSVAVCPKEEFEEKVRNIGK